MKDILDSVRWSITLGAKFVRVVPLHTFIIVLLTLVSQIAALLASFLPLKVVILLGSEGMPNYFPAIFSQVNRELLIGILSAATVGFFVLHLLSERLIDVVTSRSARHLLEKSQKIILFENQAEVAENAYQRYSRALGGGIFVFLTLLGLAPFYGDFVGVVVGYLFISLCVISILNKVRKSFHEKFEANFSSMLKLVGAIGFFVSFGYIVADFIYWKPPGFIVAVVALLANRQIAQRLIGAVGDIVALKKQRLKLNALFFHGKTLLPEKARVDKTLWPLLDLDKREDWIRLVLSELLSRDQKIVHTYWHQLGVQNIAGLQVLTEDARYLIKLFEVNRSSLALHETTLLTESVEGLPSLPWVGATQIGNHHCLVYCLPAGKSPSERQAKKNRKLLKKQLLSVSPPKSLVQRFQRSKPMLWQRLDGVPWERLQVAVNNSEQVNSVKKLLEEIPFLKKELMSLPVAVVLPNIQPEALWIPKEGRVLFANWGRWSLEPIGAGWLEKPQMLPFLAPALAEAAHQRPALAKVLPARIELSALMYALEQECNRQNFIQALELLPLLLERIQLCKEQQEKTDLTL